MVMNWKTIATSAMLAAALIAPGATMAQAPATPPAGAAKKAAKKAEATPAATAQQIADAKAKGLVWVNTNSGVYHKDGEFYGKTKAGKFMTAADADKAGYRAAKEGAVKKAAPKK